MIPQRNSQIDVLVNKRPTVFLHILDYARQIRVQAILVMMTLLLAIGSSHAAPNIITIVGFRVAEPHDLAPPFLGLHFLFPSKFRGTSASGLRGRACLGCSVRRGLRLVACRDGHGQLHRKTPAPFTRAVPLLHITFCPAEAFILYWHTNTVQISEIT